MDQSKKKPKRSYQIRYFWPMISFSCGMIYIYFCGKIKLNTRQKYVSLIDRMQKELLETKDHTLSKTIYTDFSKKFCIS